MKRLNTYSRINNIKGRFSIGDKYPNNDIPYGNYINFIKDKRLYKEIIYFGFNFNLYNKNTIKSYPSNTVVGSNINTFNSAPGSAPDFISRFMSAKQDEIIEKFLFGVAIKGSFLNKSNKQLCSKNCISDVEDNIYLPIESQLLYEADNIKLITNQIFEICKTYFFTSILF